MITKIPKLLEILVIIVVRVKEWASEDVAKVVCRKLSLINSANIYWGDTKCLAVY